MCSSICLCICPLPIWMSFCLSVSVCVGLSFCTSWLFPHVRLAVNLGCLSVGVSVCQPACPPLYMSVCSADCLYLSFCSCIYICTSVRLAIRLSASLFSVDNRTLCLCSMFRNNCIAGNTVVTSLLLYSTRLALVFEGHWTPWHVMTRRLTCHDSTRDVTSHHGMARPCRGAAKKSSRLITECFIKRFL